MGQEAEDVPVIYLHEIKRQYMQGEAPLVILDGVKLALWAGQSVALVAPSGSGKSTLLHIAGLLESPDEGEVYVAGAPTSQLSDVERTQIRRNDIGFVYQSHRLLPEFSALENVMLPQMGCPQVMVADTNWGDPTDHTFMVIAPAADTGKLTMWKKSAVKGSFEPVDEATWLNKDWKHLPKGVPAPTPPSGAGWAAI